MCRSRSLFYSSGNGFAIIYQIGTESYAFILYTHNCYISNSVTNLVEIKNSIQSKLVDKEKHV